MILTTKRAYKKRNCNCETTCNCTPKRAVKIENNFDDENYDDENRFDNASTLEEHFENFGEAIGDVAENFLRSKAGKQRAKARKEARQEKRISRIKGRQTLREKRIESKIKALESAPVIKEQAETQAQQVNQLASAVQPQSAPISAVETPTGSGYNAPLYQTLPMNEAPTPSGLTGMGGGSMGAEEGAEQEAPQTATGKEIAPIESPKKKSSKTLYLIIGAVAIAGVIYFMRKKK
jgi:hypothetical protein